MQAPIAFNMGFLPLSLASFVCASLIFSDKFILFMHFLNVLNSYLIALPIRKLRKLLNDFLLLLFLCVHSFYRYLSNIYGQHFRWVFYEFS